MSETVEHVSEHGAEHGTEQGHHTRFRAGASLLLTVLAVLLAVVALLVQRGLKNEVVASVDLSGTRGSLETAQLLQAEAGRNAAELTTEAQLPGLSDEARAALQQEASAEQAQAGQEADDPAGGSGAKQLGARLLRQQHQEHEEETQVERLEYGEVLLETALVLGSLAVLLSAPVILLTSVLAGIGGVVVAAVALVL
jgi:hypothetical protein